MAARNITFTAIAPPPPPPPGGPDWWQGINGQPAFPAGSWRTVANGAGQKISDCVPNPIPNDPTRPNTTGVSSVCSAWTGGTVDQANRQLIFAANGGDGDYCGNEVYGLSLGVNNPGWARIGEPTPQSNIVGCGGDHLPYFNVNGVTPPVPTVFPAALQMRGDHTCWDPLFYNGKVWFTFQSSIWPGPNSCDAIFSWNKALAAGGAPASAAWQYWGRHNTNTTGYIFCAASLDQTTGKIWRMAKYHLGGYFSIDVTNAGAKAVYGGVPGGNGFIHDGGVACISEELRTWFVFATVGDPGQQRIAFMDLETRAWNIITTGPLLTWASSAGKFPGSGAVYYHNGALYLGAPHSMQGTIRKLVVPTIGSGASMRPDPNSGAWMSPGWVTLPNNGTPPIPVSSAGSYSKFNIIRDMGNGQAALVTCDSINGATYVYKVP